MGKSKHPMSEEAYKEIMEMLDKIEEKANELGINRKKLYELFGNGKKSKYPLSEETYKELMETMDRIEEQAIKSGLGRNKLYELL